MRMKQLSLSLTIVFASVTAAQAAPGDAGFNQRFIESSRLLREQQTQAEYWEYGWGGFDGATLAYSTAQAITENNDRKRNGNIVQAVESLVGLADVVFRPLPAFSAERVCAPTDSPVQCLAAKEALLRSSAERAHEPYEALPHLANAGFNAAAGLLISQIGTTNDALTTAISGEIIGELQIWTTPQGPRRDFDQYQAQFHPILIQDGSLDKAVPGIGVSWKL